MQLDHQSIDQLFELAGQRPGIGELWPSDDAKQHELGPCGLGQRDCSRQGTLCPARAVQRYGDAPVTHFWRIPDGLVAAYNEHGQIRCAEDFLGYAAECPSGEPPRAVCPQHDEIDLLRGTHFNDGLGRSALQE